MCVRDVRGIGSGKAARVVWLGVRVELARNVGSSSRCLSIAERPVFFPFAL